MLKSVIERAELREVVSAVVREVLDVVARDRLADPIAFDEVSAARMIGVPRHVLADARRRGEIVGSRVGKRVVYVRQELDRYLVAQQGNQRNSV